MKHTDLKALFHEMTLEEKVGQTVQLTGDFFNHNTGAITGPFADLNIPQTAIKNAGSVVGVVGAKEVTDIQKRYMKQHRLGIPLLFMADVIHGYKTIFPIPLGMASSWNPELVEQAASVSAKEAAISGIHVTFSPMVDLVRDARWGRVMESTGEDPYLNEIFAKSFVKGYQGDQLKEDFSKVAACVKHFVGYGAPVAGRDYNTVDISERNLREFYFSSFQKALETGAKMVMTSFNTVDSIPATSNKWLMRDVLRKEFDFDGVLISDWGSIFELTQHGTAYNLKEATQQSLEAGVDIDLMAGAYAKHLETVVTENLAFESLLDEAVWRILTLKNDLGLFENPYRGADVEEERTSVFSSKHREIAKKVAEESIVLLKNEAILPLQKKAKIALIGPKIDTGDLLGSWSSEGSIDETPTLKEVLSKEISQDNLLILSEEEFLSKDNDDKLKQTEVIILALGEISTMSGEGASRSEIQLPDHQNLLLEKARDFQKTVVSIVFSGRPLDLTKVDAHSDSILQAWFPGTEGAQAITNILYGKVNPTGRLTMSFPRNVGQVPIYYNYDSTGRPLNEENKEFKYVSRYLDVENSPLYPFGYGLSYTDYIYTDLSVNKTEFHMDETIQVTVNVTNSGNRSGTEIVQLYVRDKVAEVVRPVKELKKFKRVKLDKGETKTVTFELCEKDFQYVHTDYTIRTDPGQFIIMVGKDSQNVQSVTVNIKTT